MQGKHSSAGSDPIGTVRRWERAGGVWRVTRRDADVVVVALMRCDAGEVVDEVSSSLAEWIAGFSDRHSSET